MLLISSAVFIGLGSYAAWSYISKFKRLRIEGSEVEATIVSIRGTRRHRKVMISFIFNGKEYTTSLKYYSTGMRIGDKIKLYVHDKNPYDFICAKRDPVVIGIICMLVGIALSIAPAL